VNTASLRYWAAVGGILLAGVSIALIAAEAGGSFVSIFDGKTLKGWHVSGKTGHSRASKNQSCGKWVV